MRISSVFLLAVGLGWGCLPQPRSVEVRLVSDTNDTVGPYQVMALVRDPTGITDATLVFSGLPAGTPEDTYGQVVMRRLAPQDRYDRYAGDIPGYPVGTTVRYGVQLCNRLGTCAVEPAGWPDQEAFSFVVGRLPSRPRVTAVAPDQGPTAGGLRVEITGRDFRPDMDVEVGGNPCSYVEVLSTERAACILPPGTAGPADVTAINPDGETGTLADGFVYYETPMPLRVIPSRGPTAGGTAVRVEGRFFVPGSRVTFEGRHARFVTVVSDTEIQCETPPGNAGFADVAVSHPLGGQGVLPRGYQYVPPPVVDGVIPPEGPDFGGQQVTVTGENFQDGATVTVGGQVCSDVQVISGSEIRCVVPAGTPGAADVTVQNPDGQEGTLPGGYYYNGPPLVLGVDPPEGPLAGGDEAWVLGAGFQPGMTVSFGGVPATVIMEGSRDRVRVRVPAAAQPLFPAPASGTRGVTVRVVNPAPDGRNASLQNAYTYFYPPEITSVVPDRGPTAGGTPVSVRGRFFRVITAQPLSVAFDGAAATSVRVVSTTEITCVTPPGEPGPADVSVQNHPASTGVGMAVYTYVPPPRPDRVVPADGPTFGGDTVTVEGEFFQGGATVLFDGAPCTNVMVAANGRSLTCVTPAGQRGPADVTVINPDGQEGTLARGYTYVGLSAQPPGGFEVGFTRVRIRAAGMQPGVQIRFGNVPATQVTRVSAREVIAQSPPQGVGVVDVAFVNPDGTGEMEPNAFQYRRFNNRTNGNMPVRFDTGNDADVADVDGDGDPDVVVANGSTTDSEISSVYLNRLIPSGMAGFERVAIPGAMVANQASLADLDGDGKPDLLLAASNGSTVYRNNGAGQFSAVTVPNNGDGAFEGVLTDLTGDGLADIFLLNIGCSNVEMGDPCNPSVVGRDTFLVNRGGNFQFDDRSALVPHDSALVHDHKVELADLDHNGKPDLVVVVDNKNYQGEGGVLPRHRVLLNFFPQPFQERRPPDLAGIVGDVYGIAVVDLDGDGNTDVVLPNYLPSNPGLNGDVGTPGSTVVLMGGPGVDLQRDDSRLGVGLLDEPTISVVTADLDGDGDAEIISCNLGGVSRLFVNKGDGTFVPAGQALPGQARETVDVGVADFDGDGDLDLVVINQGQDELWLAEPNP